MIIFEFFPLKRLWAHRWLAGFLALGLVTAVSLSAAVPVYADGVNHRLLQAALTRSAEQSQTPSFTFLFRYIGSWHGAISLEQYTPVDQYLGQQAVGEIGLPTQAVTHYVSTDNLLLHLEAERVNPNLRPNLVKLAYISDVFEHIRLVEGEMPAARTRIGRDSEIEALVSLKMANDLGLRVGQTYLLTLPARGGNPPYQQRIFLSGIWLPIAPDDEFWFYPPETFEKRLLVKEETFIGLANSDLSYPVHEAVWRLALDGSSVRSEAVPGLLARSTRMQNRVASLLPNTNLEISPLPALRQYQGQAFALTGVLFIFSAPVIGLVLYFTGMAAASMVRYQSNEIAILRSRGASRLVITGLFFGEWLLLSSAGVSAGLSLSLILAGWISRSQAFLDFSSAAELSLRLTAQGVLFGLSAAVLAVVFALLPAWSASRLTIISYKQDRARQSRRPFWQRAYLDILLLVPAGYGLYLLLQSGSTGSLRILGRTLERANPYENPALFLLPTLFMLGFSLLLLRLLPVFFSSLAWFTSKTKYTIPVLALRQLSRSPSSSTAPMLLLVFTLSLAGFSTTMAATLDRHLVDSVYYEIGADLNLVESGEFTGLQDDTQPENRTGGTLIQGTSSAAQNTWNFLPISDHLSLPGVEAAARVGRYSAELQSAGRRHPGRVLGVDRLDFPSVAAFRPDFAGEPLVSLMNRLALDPAGLLVDSITWSKLGLNPGDPVNLRVTISGETRTLVFNLAGIIDYFPTYFPAEGALFVVNLDYIFESFGGTMPHNVWLKTAPDSETSAILSALRDMRVAVIRVQDARDEIQNQLSAPHRQGVLGLLSIGFLSASILTAAGFLLFNLFSYKERFAIFGVLRAIGLSGGQMAAALLMEQVLLIASGLAVGMLVALLTSFLFIPHIPAGMGSYPGIPPYIVQIAWIEIIHVSMIFTGMLLVGMLVTILLLRWMKIYQALKSGEGL
jgi:putative ABC transport system permease protein